MSRQFIPKLAKYTWAFLLLSCLAPAILAQNPSEGSVAARDATQTRGRRTSRRPSPPNTLASLDRRPTLSLPPVVIYYSRDGAEVPTKKSPVVEKRNDGIGESITIYYGGKKSPLPNLAKSVSKSNASSPPSKSSVAKNPSAEAVPATDSLGRATVAAPKVDQSATGAVTTPVAPDSRSATTADNPVGSETGNSKTAEPAAVSEVPAAKTVPDEKAKAVDSSVVDSKTSSAIEPTTETESKAGEPPIPNPPADTKPAPESGEPKSSTDTKLASETAVAPSITSPAGTKQATDTAPSISPTDSNAAPAPNSPPADVIAMNNTAVQLTGQNRYDEAADLLRRAIQAKPDSYKLHRNLSIVYERMNKLDGALEAAKTAVNLAPREPSSLIQLCGIQLQVRQHIEAAACYEKLSKIEKLDPMSETYYGVALLGAGRVLDSLAVLEKAAATGPANGTTLNALGVVYFNERRYADAVKVFKQSVELEPDQHAQRFNLAIAYLANGNKESALSQYRVLKQEDAKLAEQLYLILFRDKVVSVDDLRHR